MSVVKNAKKAGKRSLALILSLSVLLCGLSSLSVTAKENDKDFTRLYDYDELAKRYLSENEEAQSEYPNGAFMFPLSSSQLKQDEFYAVDVFREGGTKGEASITVKSVDLTACYGVDYEIFLDNKSSSTPVDGEANPYYDMEEYSFIATHTQSERIYPSNNDENTQQVRKNASKYNDYLLNEVMPTSSEFTLNFADGEKSKTVYIQTHQKDEVTANLEFTLNLCNPTGGSIGAQTSCAFTILEDREIPPTYLELVDTSVNPNSDEAYVTVKRTGNMGTTGTFSIRTESATAKAGQSYKAVQMPLEFTPGMSEIKIPVTMLDGAKNGTYFNVCLDDITVADSKSQTGKVNITDMATAEERHLTTLTASEEYVSSSMVDTNTGTRGVQIIDASQFDVATATDRGTGSQNHAYKADGADMKLEYDNNWSSKNNCVSARSREKINFTGVDSITIAIDNFGGSTASDDQLFYVADTDKFQSNTSNYDWVHELGGIGGCWNMTNIGDSFIQRTANLDQNQVKGAHYLYLALHKGAVVGYAGYKVYNRGAENLNHNAVMTDCGDDIFIAWNKCMIASRSNNRDLLNSVGIATIFYNKESGKFHDYRVISDKSKKQLYMMPKVVYNSESDSVQMFYQSMNMEKVTLDTTIEELQSMPTALLTSTYSAETGKWSAGEALSINGKYLKYFDAVSYGDETLLSYVASDTYGFTLDSIDEFEVESNFDSSQFETNNSLYIQSFKMDNGKMTSSNPMRLTKDGYVTANPRFININTQGVENTLLFYKCNGAYAYQNITNIFTNGLYSDADGYSQISNSYVEPNFISEKDDYTTNDDFSVFTNGSGDIYALWTTTESNQQQIWARQFVFNRFDKVTEVGKLDSDGVLMYDENSNPITEKLDNPIYLLNGYWGGKTYLTENGIYGSKNAGLYKGNFSAVVLENGDLLTAFNAFDRKITDEGCTYVNNMFVVSEYNTDSEYHMPEAIDAIEFGNDYPTGGETVNVTCHAENLGIKSGRNVTVTLYVNGKAYDSTKESVWLSAEAKAFDFYYTLPDDKKADEVSMYFTVTENGEEKLVSDSFSFKQGADLDITSLTLSEINLINDDNDNTKFFVRATVQNKGNEDYSGGDYVRLVDYDVEEMCKAMEDGYKAKNPIYTSFGREKINSIKIGNTAEVCFISDDIPSQVFEKTGTDTAYLECLISDKNEKNWKTRNSEEDINVISEFYPGLTSKPVPEKVQSLSIDDVAVKVDESKKLDKTVQPVASQINSKITYTSSDESIATVDNFGVVTGHKEGKVIVTATVNGITDTANVIVDNSAVTPTKPTDPTVPNPSDSVTSETTPTDSAGNGTQINNNSDAVQTGGIILTAILFALIISAAVVIYMKKQRNKF